MFRFVSFYRFIGWFFLASISATGLVLASFYLYLNPKLPDVEQLKTTQFQIPLRVYSRDEKLIAEFGEKRRSPISIQDVPQDFINAFIASEDNRFYSHHGVDIKGLMRAVVQLISTGQIQSGGSTISMQVAKNFFLSNERKFTRKFNEILLALQIEQELTKPEILELYFNKIYLGNRAYGIAAAAQVYYGKNINELTLAEMAMIAGLPKAPSRYNPLANAERAKIRRDWILDRMLELDYIKADQHQLAQNSPVSAEYFGAQPELEASYLAEMARSEAIGLFGREAYTAGLKIYLTIDSRLQISANNALRNGLDNYTRRHGYFGPERTVDTTKLNDPTYLQQELSASSKVSSLIPAIVLSTADDHVIAFTTENSEVLLPLESMDWARPYIDENKRGPKPQKASDVLKPGDVIRIAQSGDAWTLGQIPKVQGAVVALNPTTGAIEALNGGYDFDLSKFNRAIQAKRQPGSNLKPFIYLAALEQGATAATMINDAPIVFEDNNLETAWRPENSSGKFFGPTRLRQALYNSRNLVSIRLLRKTGINATLKYLQRFGFNPSELPKDLSLALGSAGITPFDVATAYARLANGGFDIKPYFIDHITDNDGNPVWQHKPKIACSHNCPAGLDIAPRIADERAVYIMHSMLRDVINYGTGRKARSLKRSDIAGKTGTTNDQKDAWFSGFNNQIATTTWVGFDQPTSLGRREYGATAALPIWMEFMQTALDQTPDSQMTQPDGIVTVKINKTTGKAAQANDTDTIFEIFRNEYAPKLDSHTTNASDAIKPTNSNITLPEDIF